MAKGADVLMRKKNKAMRKKLEKNGSNLSARVASIIAAKKRRLSGKRRQCQGMCFSLPTEDDPFNERHGKKDLKTKDAKKIASSRVDERSAASKKEATRVKSEGKDITLKDEKKKSLLSNTNLRLEGSVDHSHQKQACENSGYPSKFLIMCLNAIERALHHDDTCNNEDDKPLFSNPWGVEFLKGYSTGKDTLETGGSACTIEQIAWMVSIAADTIARKEKEGLSFTSPFLLFLVPSQEKAAEVRSICKPLKALGIHTVSLHSGASIDHQIHGLTSCEPEFLVATPKRLLELISLKAIDISGVSFLVVDGLESLCKDGPLDTLTSIRHLISGNPYTVVFNNFFSSACVPTMQALLRGSVHRLSFDHSIPCQGAFIAQTVNVCKTEEQKISKAIQVLNCERSRPLRFLYVVGKDKNSYSIAKLLKLNGCLVSNAPNCDMVDVEQSLNSNGRTKPVVTVINEDDLNAADLGIYEVAVLPNFVFKIDNYVQILTRMARHTINGVLHSFLSEDDVSLAGQLIEILEQCGQTVPEALRNLHLTP